MRNVWQVSELSLNVRGFRIVVSSILILTLILTVGCPGPGAGPTEPPIFPPTSGGSQIASPANLLASAADLTGSLLIDRLKKAAQDIVDRAGEQGSRIAGEAAANLLRIAADLENALGENVAKPIRELQETFRIQIERSLIALHQAEAFINATRACLNNDFQNLLAAFSGTLTNNIANVVPWASDKPVIYKVQRIDTEALYGLRTKSIQTISFMGANLEASSQCGTNVTVERVDGQSAPVKAVIVANDAQRVTVVTEPFIEPGTYVFTISLGQKKWYGCGTPNVIKAAVAVLPPPKFQVSYTIKPTCRMTQYINHPAARVDGGNDQCNGDKWFSNIGTLPDGWTYVSHQWVPESDNGCEGTVTHLGGSRVEVKYRCPERGGIFCTGARKWINGQLYIRGSKFIDQPAATDLTGDFPSQLTYGQTTSLNVAASNACQTTSQWGVMVSIIYPDGNRHDIPMQQGAGQLQNSADGAAFFWNPTTYSLSVTTPPNTCGGL